MNVTCPNCNESFDYKPKGKLKLSWRGVMITMFCGLVILGAYSLYKGINDQPLVSAVTNLGAQIKEKYNVFEQVTTTVQGRVAKQIRVNIKSADPEEVKIQAKKLIEAERNLRPTNIIVLYFYTGSGNVPLDNWYAKVTYVNVALIRDWDWGDVGAMKSIGPGTYMELK